MFPSLTSSAVDTMILSHNICADLYLVDMHSTPFFFCGDTFYYATKHMLYVKHMFYFARCPGNNTSTYHAYFPDTYFIAHLHYWASGVPTCTIGLQAFLPLVAFLIHARCIFSAGSSFLAVISRLLLHLLIHCSCCCHGVRHKNIFTALRCHLRTFLLCLFQNSTDCQCNKLHVSCSFV